MFNFLVMITYSVTIRFYYKEVEVLNKLDDSCRVWGTATRLMTEEAKEPNVSLSV